MVRILEFNLHEKNGIKIFESNLIINESNVKMLFTCKDTGCSKGRYSSLNMAEHVGDDIDNVVKNQELVLNIYGFDKSSVYYGEQTHGNNISFVDSSSENFFYNTDGLYTRDENKLLMSFYADCVPLYFIDVKLGIIGLAHAGWRGTVNKIGHIMVETFLNRFNSELQDIIVVIGPSICRKCFEVDEGVYQEFVNVFKEENMKAISDRLGGGNYKLDLWLANQLIFHELGLLDNNIYRMDLCTSCNPDLFFSYRRDGSPTGRMASIIYMKHIND